MSFFFSQKLTWIINNINFFFQNLFRLESNKYCSTFTINIKSSLIHSMDLFICWQANKIILIPRFSFIPKEGRLIKNKPRGVCFKNRFFFLKSGSFFFFQTEYFPNENFSKCRVKKIRRGDPCAYMKQGGSNYGTQCIVSANQVHWGING